VKRNGFRALLALACLVAIGTVVQAVRLDRSIADTRDSLIVINQEVQSLTVDLSDLRAAQMAYLAAGQDPDFWLRRVTDLSARLDSGLDRLRRAVTTPTAATHVEAAATAVADLMSADKRARTALQAEQRFVASDVIFSDSLAPSQLILSELGTVRAASADAAASSVTWQSRVRLALVPVALLAVLLSAFYAGRSSRRPEVAPPTIADMLRDLPPPVKPGGLQAPKIVAPVAAPAPAAPPLNLTEAAELCVDLARVMDARDMQGLLERTAKVLEARGLILWVVNQDGTSLLPVLTHGYSERVLLKLSALDVKADNVTCLSFRSVRPQTMLAAGPGTTSAVAVPLVTAGGCNGVLAAEVYDAKPSAEFIALSRVIAAQFATMINPCETQAPAQVAEG
jgi:hypothetical protein